MPIFLSHKTAIECWRSGLFDELLGGSSLARPHRPAGSVQIERVASMLALDRLDITYDEALAFGGIWTHEPADNKPTARAIAALKEGPLAFASDPVHVLVPGKNAANTLKGVSCHVRASALPRGSFVRMHGGAFLCAPELCFLHWASIASFVQIVKLGTELCALYTMTPDGRAGYQRTLPPTTVHALEAYLERCEGMPGLAAARKALRFVAAASGSPMETALVIALCLPPRLGGYGLPLPRMNFRIDAPQTKRPAVEKGYYLCDLYWPEARVSVEYDSDLEHTGPTRIAEDAQRRNDLASLGITTITATREQIMNAEKFDRIADQLGRMLGVRIRRERGPEPRERERFVRSLVSSHDLKASRSRTRRLATDG